MKRSPGNSLLPESRRAARPRRLALEPLESRQLLSAGPHLADARLHAPGEHLDAAPAAWTEVDPPCHVAGGEAPVLATGLDLGHAPHREAGAGAPAIPISPASDVHRLPASRTSADGPRDRVPPPVASDMAPANQMAAPPLSTAATDGFFRPAVVPEPLAAPPDRIPSAVVIDVVAMSRPAPPPAPLDVAAVAVSRTSVDSALFAAAGTYADAPRDREPAVVVIESVGASRTAPLARAVEQFELTVVLVAMIDYSPPRPASRTVESSPLASASLAHGLAARSSEPAQPQDSSQAAATGTPVSSPISPTDSGLEAGVLAGATSTMTEPTPARSSGASLGVEHDPRATTPSSVLGASDGTLTHLVDDGQRLMPAADRVSPPVDDGFVDLSPNKSRSGETTRLRDDISSSASAGQRRMSASASDAEPGAWSDPVRNHRSSAAWRGGDAGADESLAERTNSADRVFLSLLAGRLNLELPDDGDGGGMVVMDAGGQSPMAVVAGVAASGRPVREGVAGNGVPMDAACGQLQAFELAGPSLSGETPDADVASAPPGGSSSAGPAATSAALAAPEASAAADSSPDTDYRRVVLVPSLVLLVVHHFLPKSRPADRTATVGLWPALAQRWQRLWRKWQTRR